ncbi:MAG TPA: response regulator [Roseiflexaceae bacterium]|nr:response regulator [Roseiflexaceae bacterium]
MTFVHQPRILIAAEMLNVRITLDALLRRRGFRTLVVENGSNALAVYRHGAIDLVVIDLVLADMQGLELVRRLRSLDDDASVILLGDSGALDEQSYVDVPVVYKTMAPALVLDRIASLAWSPANAAQASSALVRSAATA